MYKKILLLSLLSAASYGVEKSKTLATFDGGEVTEVEAQKELEGLARANPSIANKKISELDKATRDRFIKSVANARIIDKETAKSDLKQSPEFKTQIAEIEKQLVQQLYIKNYLDKQVTESAIENEYNRQVELLKKESEYSASHILVSEEKTALDIHKKLKDGGKFDKLVSQYSQDESSKKNKGSLGYFLLGHMVPEFGNNLVKLKKGEISKPFHTAFGWHIVRLDDKRAASIPTKEDSKATIVATLQKQGIDKLVEELSQKYNLKILD